MNEHNIVSTDDHLELSIQVNKTLFKEFYVGDFSRELLDKIDTKIKFFLKKDTLALESYSTSPRQHAAMFGSIANIQDIENRLSDNVCQTRNDCSTNLISTGIRHMLYNKITESNFSIEVAEVDSLNIICTFDQSKQLNNGDMYYLYSNHSGLFGFDKNSRKLEQLDTCGGVKHEIYDIGKFLDSKISPWSIEGLKYKKLLVNLTGPITEDETGYVYNSSRAIIDFNENSLVKLDGLYQENIYFDKYILSYKIEGHVVFLKLYDINDLSIRKGKISLFPQVKDLESD